MLYTCRPLLHIPTPDGQKVVSWFWAILQETVFIVWPNENVDVSFSVYIG